MKYPPPPTFPRDEKNMKMEKRNKRGKYKEKGRKKIKVKSVKIAK
jgi:hypothetical protein